VRQHIFKYISLRRPRYSEDGANCEAICQSLPDQYTKTGKVLQVSRMLSKMNQ